jgi:hypothetical protein
MYDVPCTFQLGPTCPIVGVVVVAPSVALHVALRVALRVARRVALRGSIRITEAAIITTTSRHHHYHITANSLLVGEGAPCERS